MGDDDDVRPQRQETMRMENKGNVPLDDGRRWWRRETVEDDRK